MSSAENCKESVSDYFVICDTQEDYTENLLKALRKRISGEYQFYLFRNIEKLREFSKTHTVGILLISEEYPVQERNKIYAQKTFVLTEIYPEGNHHSREILFRYQPADQMIEIIFGYREYPSGSCAAGKKGEEKSRDAPDLKGMIGVYSPVHRIGKTKFAIKLGKQLALKKAVLYLNLEGYSGENYYFSGGAEYDLGDLIYYIRQENADPGIRISAMAGQAGGMDYIMPMKNEQDLRQVKKEEWFLLLDVILEKCIYDVVILDLGDCIDGLYEILKRCGRIYTHYIEEGAALAKIRQYEENLRMSGYGDILSRTVKKKAGRGKQAGERSVRPDDQVGTVI